MQQDIETRFLGKLGGGLDKLCSFHLRRRSQVCVCVFCLELCCPTFGDFKAVASSESFEHPLISQASATRVFLVGL